MKLVKALSTSILWRGLYFLSVMLLNILVARHFQSDGSGKIYYIINILAFFLLLISFCLEAPMGYYLSQKKLNESQLSMLALVWSLFVMIPAYVAIYFFSTASDIPFEPAMFRLLATLFLLGNLLISFFIALFYVKMEFKGPNLLLVAVNLFLILLVPNNGLVQQYISNETYIHLYFGGFLAQGVLLAFAFNRKYVRFSQISRIPLDVLKPFFSFALITVVTNSMTFLMYRIDYWFVHKYCSASDLGNYIQACKLQQLFFILPSILAAVVFPMTASGRKEEMNAKMQVLSRGLIAAYLIVCLLLAASGYWLFPFVFGNTFTNMYLPFVLLIPAILSYSVVHLLAAYFGGKKVLNVNFWGNVITLVLIVAGDILVIPSFGIKGAAIVSSAGYICYMSYMLYAHSKTYHSKFSDFLIVRKADVQSLYSLIVKP
ncbi:MAG: polysaccharide biosynthesis C-terminal domain-containing protein [Chitinophagaceae bacterium]|jgi:O-antigen/teichoic acid export membrane protein|nr:polysaccharide biosynthesis C-terminal domain-containing protein [Chitinophagaceae bacterium]